MHQDGDSLSGVAALVDGLDFGDGPPPKSGEPGTWPLYRSEDVVDLVPHLAYDQAQSDVWVGNRGFGKTTALEMWLQSLEPRVLKVGLYGELSGPPAPSLKHAWYDFQRFDACWRVVTPDRRGSKYFGEKLVAEALEYGEDLLIVIDEVTKFFGPEASDDLQELVLQGRKYRLRLAGATQRLNYLPDVWRTELTRAIVFHTSRPWDRKVIKDWTDNPKLARACKSLDVGECFLLEF